MGERPARASKTRAGGRFEHRTTDRPLQLSGLPITIEATTFFKDWRIADPSRSQRSPSMIALESVHEDALRQFSDDL